MGIRAKPNYQFAGARPRAAAARLERIVGNRRGTRGMTLIEVTVAMVVLTISVFMLTSTISSSLGQSATKYERGLASDAARNLFEEMRNTAFAQLYARYNSDPSDDPGGPGTAPGNKFSVAGLTPVPGDPDGFVGEVLMPGAGPALREDANNPTLGLPRDLNGDAMIDDKDHAGNYIVLPVGVRIEWKGKSGKQSLTLFTLFSKLCNKN